MKFQRINWAYTVNGKVVSTVKIPTIWLPNGRLISLLAKPLAWMESAGLNVFAVYDEGSLFNGGKPVGWYFIVQRIDL